MPLLGILMFAKNWATTGYCENLGFLNGICTTSLIVQLVDWAAYSVILCYWPSEWDTFPHRYVFFGWDSCQIRKFVNV